MTVGLHLGVGLRRQLASQLEAAAAVGGRWQRLSGLLLWAAREVELADREVDALQSELARHRASSAGVCVVRGFELGDGEPSEWVCGVFATVRDGQGMAAALNDLANKFGASIGKLDLVGLDPLERLELVRHAKDLDPRVRVGRHGVRWDAQAMQVR